MAVHIGSEKLTGVLKRTLVLKTMCAPVDAHILSPQLGCKTTALPSLGTGKKQSKVACGHTYSPGRQIDSGAIEKRCRESCARNGCLPAFEQVGKHADGLRRLVGSWLLRPTALLGCLLFRGLLRQGTRKQEVGPAVERLGGAPVLHESLAQC